MRGMAMPLTHPSAVPKPLLARLTIVTALTLTLFGSSAAASQAAHAQSDSPDYQEALRLGRGAIYSLAWSPDGNLLAVGGAIGVWIYTGALEDVALLEGLNFVQTLAWSPDGSSLAAGDYDGVIKTWDTSTRQVTATLEDHTSAVRTIAWSPDSSQIASGGEDRTLRIWDVSTGQEVHALEHSLGIRDAVWTSSKNGVITVVGLGPTGVQMELNTWDAVSGERVSSLQIENTPDETSTEPPVQVLSVTRIEPTYRPIDRLITANFLITSSGLTILLLISLGTTVYAIRRNLPRTRKLLTVGLSALSSLAILLGCLYSCSVWFLSGLPDYPQGYLTTAAALSADGTRLATTDWLQGTVDIWDVASGERPARLRGGFGEMHSLAWSPDGELLAIAESDEIGIIRFDSGELKILPEPQTDGPIIWSATEVAWSADDQLAVIYQQYDGNRSELQTWDARNWQDPNTLSIHRQRAYAVAWHPEGERLAGSFGDHTKIWDATSGEVLLTLDTGSIDVEWAPDGERIATAS
jgi:WD40 repeat protein